MIWSIRLSIACDYRRKNYNARVVDFKGAIPQKIHSAWLLFSSSKSSLESLGIRRYCLKPNMISLHLHGFCDATIRAYG